MAHKAKFTYVDEDGIDVEVELPVKYAVCPNCEGHGTHLTPSIRDHAFSREEFEEAFDDEEDRAEYFRRGGRYDVVCERCDGQRVVAVPDEGRMLGEQRVQFEAYQAAGAERYRTRAEDARTERMEAGDWL